MFLISHKHFQTEIKRLRKIIAASELSFKETRSKIIGEIKAGKLKNDDVVPYPDGGPIKIVSFVGALKNQIPRYLRELIFVRAMSAFEVYLIDSIREIGKIDPALFGSSEGVEIPREKIFASTSIEHLIDQIIDQDCRSLGSGGFLEITKYYKNRLGIDYSSLQPGQKVLEEYHDRRHILVHRLGMVDKKYTHKYNFSGKKISVDDLYLTKVLADLDTFTQAHNSLILSSIFNLPFGLTPLMYRCVCVFQANMGSTFLKPDFSLISGKKLGDILRFSKIKNGRTTFVLEGEATDVTAFAQLLKNRDKNGELKINYINPKSISNDHNQTTLS